MSGKENTAEEEVKEEGWCFRISLSHSCLISHVTSQDSSCSATAGSATPPLTKVLRGCCFTHTQAVGIFGAGHWVRGGAKAGGGWRGPVQPLVPCPEFKVGKALTWLSKPARVGSFTSGVQWVFSHSWACNPPAHILLSLRQRVALTFILFHYEEIHRNLFWPPPFILLIHINQF